MSIWKLRTNSLKIVSDNKLQEVEFIAELRELEHVILAEQERLEHINHEKSRLQNELIETERLILLWERKIQLARETIAAVDSEVGQGEIKSMRSEIHRMELKFKELMLAQEALMKEMEYSGPGLRINYFLYLKFKYKSYCKQYYLIRQY